MNFNSIAPTLQLSAFVKHIEVITSGDSLQSESYLRFFADGCPGIIFSQSDRGFFTNACNEKLCSFYLYGQTIKPINLFSFGQFTKIIFYLKPHVLNSLFKINASEITETCLDISLLQPKATPILLEKLSETTSIESQIRLISDFLTSIASKDNPNTILQHATEAIIRYNGKVLLTDLHKKFDMSERTFERKFENSIGVSPRLFARVCQFRSALTQLHSYDFTKLSDIAYENGFSDQSHFIRTFKEFTGVTPKLYLSEFENNFAIQPVVSV
ncbi:helix-turn-helix transcriptional regulator [Flavobacterium microcysteis]|uniref:Helix-turn-helix transcriptional regulator n=1 Tax=Flavobacterium microcysteis TaxID=2596891 RepID=A0A501Q4J1_9FLAO|nr:helix-turn-helix transcriptional regulator [Flavobacterium microcysteis]TPD67272.1 helix-turn-helix transcriptional regulator [Flavobacterium microcysteis]